MKIKLLSNRVLIKEDLAEEKTASGLIVSKGENPSEFSKGTVVAIGTGKYFDENSTVSFVKRRPMETKVGDSVIYQYGKTVYFDGEQFHMVNESDIVAIL